MIPGSNPSNARPARSHTGARRFRFPARTLLAGLALGAALVSPARAGVEQQDGPLPWRVGGRVGFTLDAATLPDSAGLVLELYLRVPPATILQLSRDANGDARMHATVRVNGRFGAKALEWDQDFSIAAADSAFGQGKVVIMRFAAAPGACRVHARLEDLNSQRKGLLHSGREAHESVELEGDLEVPRAQAGRDLSDLEFLWPTQGRPVALAFLRRGRAVVPNPERLYGLYSTDLHAAFIARGKRDDPRRWHWVARVFDSKGEGVAQVESTAVAGPLLDGDVTMDLSREPAGGYDLEIKAWQEGDTGALLRRARFSIGWQSDTWLRNAADVMDEVHFLVQANTEEGFEHMQPGEQERFLDDFWRVRDPTPETAFNEAYATFRERVQHANETWTRVGLDKGMFSDQGRTYIRYGPPTELLRQVIPAGDETLSEQLSDLSATEDRDVGDVHQRGLGGDMRPFEVWVYEGDIPLPFDADPQAISHRPPRHRIVFLFVDQQGTGNFTLRYSTE